MEETGYGERLLAIEKLGTEEKCVKRVMVEKVITEGEGSFYRKRGKGWQCLIIKKKKIILEVPE